MKIIALMGPSRGGKSSIANVLAEVLEGRIVRLSFADSLKEASVKHGYRYEKTNEQRCILQEVSATMKSEFGEDVFSKATVAKLKELNNTSAIDYAIIDDLRHSVERSELVYANEDGIADVRIVRIDEVIAERVWEYALSRHVKQGDEFTWATHRSELEWRGFRHMYQSVVNRKDIPNGIEAAVNSVLSLVTTQKQGECYVG